MTLGTFARSQLAPGVRQARKSLWQRGWNKRSGVTTVLLPALLRSHLGNEMLAVLEALGQQADQVMSQFSVAGYAGEGGGVRRPARGIHYLPRIAFATHVQDRIPGDRFEH
jgi:hypothetical protein